MSNIEYLYKHRYNRPREREPAAALADDYVIRLDRPLNLGLPAGEVLGSGKSWRRLKHRLRSGMVKTGCLLVSAWKATSTAIVRRRSKSLIGKLFRVALATNRSDFHVFVDFSGHVELLEVRIFGAGWTEKEAPVYVLRGRLASRTRPGMTPGQLRAAITLIRSLSAARRHGI